MKGRLCDEGGTFFGVVINIHIVMCVLVGVIFRCGFLYYVPTGSSDEVGDCLFCEIFLLC